jgi:hypothetical protein
MEEAKRAGMPVRLKVADTNDPSMQLYPSLGFVVASDEPLYVDMEMARTSLVAREALALVKSSLLFSDIIIPHSESNRDVVRQLDTHHARSTNSAGGGS